MEQQDLRRRNRSEKHQNFSEGVPAGQVWGKCRITSCQFISFSCTEDLHPKRFFRVNIRSESERWGPVRRLGERFFRVDSSETRRVGGTGLGVRLVTEVLAAHGAKLEVDSEEGKGSAFHFVLPLAGGGA